MFNVCKYVARSIPFLKDIAFVQYDYFSVIVTRKKRHANPTRLDPETQKAENAAHVSIRLIRDLKMNECSPHARLREKGRTATV